MQKYELRVGRQLFATLEPYDDEEAKAKTKDVPDILLGHVVIADIDFHIEAHRVITDDDDHLQKDQYASNESFLDPISDISGAGAPFQTVTLHGHEYVVCIYPFCN